MSYNKGGMTVVIPYEVVEMAIHSRDSFKALDKNTGLRLANSERLQSEVGELVTAIILKAVGSVPLLANK